MNAVVMAPLHGEILPPQALLRVVASMHPFSTSHSEVLVPAGSSVQEIVERCAEDAGMGRRVVQASVTIEGVPVAPEWWSRVRVKQGAHIVVRAVPGKGVGSILKSILSIALIILATIVAPGIGTALGVSTTLVTGVIVFAGNFLLNALFPAAKTSTQDSTKTAYSIGGARNGVAKWGPIPVLLGTARIAPNYAASPYTEFSGDDQYVRMLFVWGQGPMKIGPIRIGETLLSDFEGVEVQTFEGYSTDGQQTLYPSEVVQEELSIEMKQGMQPIRTTADNASEIVVDLVAPNGIVNINMAKGTNGPLTVDGRINLIDPATGSVVAAQSWNFTASSKDPLRRSYRFVAPSGGPFDVQVTRHTPDFADSLDHTANVVWTALKTYRASPPIEYSKPLAITAIRIRATEQLNGVPDNVNAICTSRARSWNGSAWIDDQETSNPADLFRLVLQGPGIARRRSDAEIDLSSVENWADMCRNKGFKFNMLRDFSSSVPDTLRDICAAGRGVPTLRDGKWSVAWEDELAPIVQYFTPRNTRDFTWTNAYRYLPHALRVKFQNERKGWIEDERLVYDDGYSSATATLFEQAEFPGVTDPDLVYKHGRYRIADAHLRTALYRMTVDFEHLICTRGDRVRVSHDTIRKDSSTAISGRVKSVAGQVITLDEDVLFEAGQTYGIRFRLKDGSSIVRVVAAAAGWHSSVTIAGSGPAVGDMFMFGLLDKETAVYRVLAIHPMEDLSAEMELVDDAPGIQNADTGPVTGDDGVVIIPPPATDYYPRNLQVSSQLETRGAEVLFSTRVSWTVLTGPTYERFELIASDAAGAALPIVTVPGTNSSGEFINLSPGYWTFVVRAILFGGSPTRYSDPLTILIETPLDRIGVAAVNIAPDVRDILEQSQSAISRLSEIVESLASSSFIAIGDNVEEIFKASSRITVEEIKREADDQAAGERTTRVETRLGSVETGYLGQAAAVETLRSSVTKNGEDIRANAEAVLGAITRLDNVDGINNAQAGSILSLASSVQSNSDGIQANAEAILGANAMVNGLFASGLIRFQASATPSGVSSRIAIVTRASSGDSFVESGIYIDAMSDGTRRIVNLANRFIITDGTNLQQAFVFQDGVLRLNAAVIGSLIVPGTITTDKIAARQIDAERITLGGVDMINLAQGAATGFAAVSGNDAQAVVNVRDGNVAVKARGTAGSPTTLLLYRDNLTIASIECVQTGTRMEGPSDNKREVPLYSIPPFIFIVDSPSQGFHTYRATHSSISAPCFLEITNYRR